MANEHVAEMRAFSQRHPSISLSSAARSRVRAAYHDFPDRRQDTEHH